MKILMICKKMPYPPRDGETIAIWSLADAYANLGHEVTVLAMNTKRHFVSDGEIPTSIRQKFRIQTLTVNTSPSLAGAFLNLFQKDSYHLSRFNRPDFRELLSSLLKREKFDLIQLEGVYLGPYLAEIRELSKAITVVRAHNVEHEIWERISAQAPFWKRWYFQLQAKRLHNEELGFLNQADAVLPITGRDLDQFRIKKVTVPMKAVLAGLPLNEYLPGSETADTQSLFFLGGMDWLPNQEAVDWFLAKIWHVVKSQNPQAIFRLAGRNMPERFFQLKMKGVEVLGEVEDAAQFMKANGIMVVPLLSGSGMRIKIIEAMALGKAIITTRTGAEGIPCTDEYDLLLADSEADFVQKTLKLLTSPARVKTLGINARQTALQHFDSQSLAASGLEFLQETFGE